MKRKVLTAMVLAGCMAFGPAAVFAEEAPEAGAEATEETAEEATEETVEETAEEAPEEATEETEAAPAELTDNLYDFQVKIGEEVYQFPMTFEEFTAKGWALGKNDSPDTMVGSNSYTSATFLMGENSIYADVFNLGINELPLDECLIGGISLDGSYGMDIEANTVELAGGIVMGQANVDDIKAAYGEPTDTYEGDLYTKLGYDQDMYQSAELYVYKDDNTLKEIDIRNFVEPEGFDKGSVSTETPEIVAAYTAPSSLGDDFMEPVVEFCGDLYQLPAPVSAFTANGWALKDISDEDYVSGRDIAFIDMTKENQTVHFSVYNHTENAVTVENCFVRELEVGSYDPESITLKLSGDVTLGAAKKDLIAAAEAKGYLCEENDDYLNVYKTADTKLETCAQFWFNKDEDPEAAATVCYTNEIIE